MFTVVVARGNLSTRKHTRHVNKRERYAKPNPDCVTVRLCGRGGPQNHSVRVPQGGQVRQRVEVQVLARPEGGAQGGQSGHLRAGVTLTLALTLTLTLTMTLTLTHLRAGATLTLTLALTLTLTALTLTLTHLRAGGGGGRGG